MESTSSLIEQAIQNRLRAFGDIRSRLSPALRHAIETKLQTEFKAAEALVSADKTAAAQRSHYSFVLDPQYFEQKFLR